MTISKRVQQELQQVAPDVAAMDNGGMPDDFAQNTTREARARREALAAKSKGQQWTKDEHEKFLSALAKFPSGPWEAIAEAVGTKNARQTMTHAQKCRQKNERRARGLRTSARRSKKARTTSESESNATATVTTEHTALANAVATAVRTDMDVAHLLKTESSISSLDSPRSGEEEFGDDLLLRPLGDAMVREIFAQFPAPPSLQSAWSTSSFPDAPLDLDLDDLTLGVLPDEFSLQWAV